MNMCEIQIGGHSLQALGSGALWWADAGVLVVSDMHLGKSDRIARRGGAMLPPYETRATLEKLVQDLATTGAQTVISLGDSFDDDLSATGLDPEDHATLQGLTETTEWIWISGNHDPAPSSYAGQSKPELWSDPFHFRHIASEALGATEIEVSGHYHPKLRLQTRAGMVSRAAFAWTPSRLILPAYGAYTGGLDLTHPALQALLSKDAMAVLTGPKPIAVPAFPNTPRPRQAHPSASPRPPLRRGNFG